MLSDGDAIIDQLINQPISQAANYLGINSSPPSAAYMRKWIRSACIGSDNGLSPIRCQAII